MKYTGNNKLDMALIKAYEHIVDNCTAQGRVLDAKTLYGDGTRFLPLTLKDFELMLNDIKGM